MNYLKTLNLKNYFQIIKLKIYEGKNMILDILNLKRCLKLKDVINILSILKKLRYLDLQNNKNMEKIGNKVYLESYLILMNLKRFFNFKN